MSSILMDRPYEEARSSMPAIAGASVAASLILLLAFFVLAGLFPAVVMAPYGPTALDPGAFGSILRAVILGERCAPGLETWIGIDCRLSVLNQVSSIIRRSPAAMIGLTTCVAASGAAFLMAYLNIWQATPKREKVRTLKGFRPVYDADGREGLRAALSRIGGAMKRGLWIAPHVQLTRAAEGYNLMALGTQGSGKTSTLRAMIEQLIDRGDRVIVHDVKGDMYAGLPTRCAVLIAPHDRRSWAYDLAADIQNREHAREFAVHAIQPTGSDAMWGQGAQAIWTDLVMSLRADRGSEWSWPDLSGVLLAPGAVIKERLDAHKSLMSARLSGDTTNCPPDAMRN